MGTGLAITHCRNARPDPEHTELDEGPPGLEQLVERVGDEPVTLVFSARDLKHNQAVALKEYLEGVLEK